MGGAAAAALDALFQLAAAMWHVRRGAAVSGIAPSALVVHKGIYER